MSDDSTKASERLIPIAIEFVKPPVKFLGFTIYCRHVWKRYWHEINECTSVELTRCARCLKDKEKWKGEL